MDISKLAKGIFSFLALAVFGVAAHAQEECVGISNDIARLQCFDQAYEGGDSASSMSLETAYSRFSDLVTSEFEREQTSIEGVGMMGVSVAETVGVAAKDNFCDIILVSTGHDVAGTFQGNIAVGRIQVVALNAGDLAAVDDGYSTTTRLRAKRGAKFLGFYHSGQELGGIDNVRSLHQAILNNFPSAGFPVRSSDKSKESNSMNIRLVTRESRIDKGKIYRALMDLSKACS